MTWPWILLGSFGALNAIKRILFNNFIQVDQNVKLFSIYLIKLWTCFQNLFMTQGNLKSTQHKVLSNQVSEKEGIVQEALKRGKRRITPTLIYSGVRPSAENSIERQSRQDDVIDRWEPTAAVQLRSSMTEPAWRRAIIEGCPTPKLSDSESESEAGFHVPSAFTSLRDLRPAQEERQRQRMTRSVQRLVSNAAQSTSVTARGPGRSPLL